LLPHGDMARISSDQRHQTFAGSAARILCEQPNVLFAIERLIGRINVSHPRIVSLPVQSSSVRYAATTSHARQVVVYDGSEFVLDFLVAAHQFEIGNRDTFRERRHIGTHQR
jgi:hypothetical protein